MPELLPSPLRSARLARRRAPFAALVLVVQAACLAPSEPPLVAPDLRLGVRHYPGSPLAGPGSPGSVDRDALALLVGCRVLYLRSMPRGDEVAPLAARTRLVVAVRGDEPLLASAVLARGARVATGEGVPALLSRLEEEPGASVEVGRLYGALPPGVSAAFVAESEDWIESVELGPVRKEVELHVTREEEGEPALVLVFEDLARTALVSPRDEEAGPAPEVLHREMIVLEDHLGETPLVLLFHSPFRAAPDGKDRGGRSGVFAAVVERLPAEGQRFEGTLAQCLAQVATPEHEDERAEDSGWSTSRTTESALAALEVPRFRRAALAFLASRAGAPLAEDVALSAEDAVLSALSDAVLAAREAAGARADAAGFGWTLEREAWLLFARLQTTSPPLPPALAGILLRHAGEVGRLPGVMRDLVVKSASIDDLAARVERENRIFLEDSNPGARVRALDWLRARGAAPADFDPLAPTHERRDALRRAREASANPSEDRR